MKRGQIKLVLNGFFSSAHKQTKQQLVDNVTFQSGRQFLLQVGS